MRAWKKTAGLSMADAGGHILSGPEIRLAPETMALRHYIFCDQHHAFNEYAERPICARRSCAQLAQQSDQSTHRELSFPFLGSASRARKRRVEHVRSQSPDKNTTIGSRTLVSSSDSEFFSAHIINDVYVPQLDGLKSGCLAPKNQPYSQSFCGQSAHIRSMNWRKD
jgi:hypothetical protein